MNVVIAGSSGSGKTTLARYLQANGFQALDADSDPNLSGWYDRKGTRIFPAYDQLGLDFYRRHSFLWDKGYLQQRLEVGNLYLCGSANNDFELSRYFDKKFFLSAPAELINARLQSPERDNNFGKLSEERLAVMSWLDSRLKQAVGHGFTVVDASQPIDVIARFVSA